MLHFILQHANYFPGRMRNHPRKRDVGSRKTAPVLVNAKLSQPVKKDQVSKHLSSAVDKCLSKIFGSTTSFRCGTEYDYEYAPVKSLAFKLLLICRFCSAMMANINDCDETYNYWEPAHFVIYKRGFQTWEYSPQFALRTYSFVWLYAWLLWILKHFIDSRLVLFFLLRLSMGIFCAFCELIFYRAVVKVYGRRVASLLLIFLASSPGMFHSSVAFLPSSFCMYMAMLATASVLLRANTTAIISVALSVLIAWPFSAILGIPVALDILVVQRKFKKFITVSGSTFVAIMSLMCAIDYYYYQKIVVAVWNIVFYNIFTPHGPNLYGTEPLSFYLKNGFLNNLVPFILCLSFPLVFATTFVASRSLIMSYYRKWFPFIGVYLWFIVFFAQPHKEERFLYPIYPVICLTGAVSLSLIVQVVRQFNWKTINTCLSYLTFTIVILNAVLAASRIASQFLGYHAPMDLYGEFSAWVEHHELVDQRYFLTNRENIICVGREWHKLPSSFFIPDKFRLEFIKSAFEGKMLTPYHLAKVIAEATFQPSIYQN